MTTSPKILVVDDEPVAIEVLCNAIEDLGDIRYATGGIQALAMMAEEPADLILLDARMPVLDGYDTCSALRRDYPDIPVVFVTAANDSTSEIRALAAGARDFLTKPISPPVVRARVTLHLRLKAQEDLLRSLTGRDPLTGIANRRALDERLVQEWRRALRHDQSLALLMIDIDHFKAYNDHYGHIQGDDCLRRVAQVIAEKVPRAEDLVARYGGEEFAVLLANSTRQEAVIVAERVRAAVKDLCIPHACSSTAAVVSLSVGVASCRPQPLARDQVPAQAGKLVGDQAGDQAVRQAGHQAGDQAGTQAGDQGTQGGFFLARELIEQADQALYDAKQGGRDRVCVAGQAG